MQIEPLIAAAGSITALAAHLGVSVQSVYTWKAKGIPEVRQSWIREKAPELVQAAREGRRTNPDTEQPQSAR